MFGEPEVTILVIDDEPGMRKAIAQTLAPHGYRMIVAATGETGREVFRQERPACVILDLNLPGVGGLDLLPELLEADPHLAVVVLSGDSQARTAAACMRGGVVDYLTKPFVPARLAAAVEGALRVRRERLERDEMRRWLREELAERHQAAVQEQLKLERLAAASLEVLVTALEAKDRFMAGHSTRVADLAASVAAELGRPDDEVELIRHAGRLHDLGMIGISNRILNKEGPLTEAELREIRQHPVLGEELLRMHPQLEEVGKIVRSHHERWDGTGYPDGVAGEAIPLGGRIVAAAEIYDALVTNRVYRNSRLTPEAACGRLHDLVGKALDPAVYEAVAAVVARRQALEFLVEEEPERRETREAIRPVAEAPERRAGAGA